MELIGNQPSNWCSLYLCSMPPCLKSPITVWTRWNEGMVVMGRRPMTTAALSARLCSIHEGWLRLYCGQTLHSFYVDPSTFLLGDNRWIVVSVCVPVHVGAHLRKKVGLCLFNCMCFSVHLCLTPTLSKQTLECLPSKWCHDSAFTRKLIVIALVMTDWYLTIFYRKLCC